MNDITSIIQTFISAFSRLDLDGMMEFFSEDATAFFPIEHERIRLEGKRDILSAFSRVLAKVRIHGSNSLHFDLNDIKVQEFADVAVVTFHINNDNLSRRTFVLARIEGRWMITHMHASNAPHMDTEDKI
jgi:ketosteroid isomerase-like protein